jgi:hypothetical protein
MSKIKILIISFIMFTSCYSQTGGIGTLTLPLSPISYGAGGTGTASITEDPYGFYSNPAYLGYASKTNFFSNGYLPGGVDWKIDRSTNYNSYSFSGGIDLKRYLKGMPFSIGAAYAKSQMTFGSSVNREQYSAFAFGIGYHSIINISAGMTIKDAKESWDMASEGISQGKVTAIDYGLLLNLPLNNFLCKPLGFNVSNSTRINTDFNYTLGYSIQNVGDEIALLDPMQKDPLPRAAKLAHNIDLNVLLETGKLNIGLFNISYSIDAIDGLAMYKWKGDIFDKIDYKGIFGGIKPFKNLFAGKSGKDILLRKGFSAEIGETLTLSTGGFDGEGYTNMKTDGYGIRTKGVFKILNTLFPQESFSYILEHFDIKYYHATYFKDAWDTKINGIAITITGI